MNSDQLLLSNFYKQIRRDIELNYIKENIKIIDIVNYIENQAKLHERINIAFPVGININETIAHFSPSYDSDIIIKKDDIVKIDFGFHLDGIIIDSSRSYCLSDNENINKLINTSKEAAVEVIKDIKAESYIPDISCKIEEIIKSNDFFPIGELCGHQISPYKIHDKLIIPNIDIEDLLPQNMRRIIDNNYYAIEPFCSNKITKIYGDLDNISHYMFDYHRYNDNLLDKIPYIRNNYKTLCFDIKWLGNNENIINSNLITPYPPLKSIYNNCLIAHYEETIFVSNSKNIILS